eukprot:TRINITY_DN3362_c0_g1_i1.p1 TRINITY_DN3362_c0_g1~~TRINITY_DN3362_c0_g1_i1.p1  ORF type:complete len:311 (-),score=66.36 TRINITY_DN3362_c0_g1_i1:305-1147(-)
MATYGVSNFIVKWMNVLTMVLAFPIVAMGIYLYNASGSQCESFLQKPVIIIGVFMFVMSFLGCVGAANNWSFLLWLYLVVMFFLIIILAGFTIFAFIVTAPGAGRTVAGVSFKEYYLSDYSDWLRKELNNTKNWANVESCMMDVKYCDHLNDLYTTVDAYRNASLSPTESGCCRPPAECGYQQVNATYFTIGTPASSNTDCLRYSNDNRTMCFLCQSCKGGVAEYVKDEWKTVSTVNLVILCILIFLYCIGCCAKANATDDVEFEEIEKQQFEARYQPRY